MSCKEHNTGVTPRATSPDACIVGRGWVNGFDIEVCLDRADWAPGLRFRVYDGMGRQVSGGFIEGSRVHHIDRTPAIPNLHFAILQAARKVEAPYGYGVSLGCPDCERERVHSAGGNHFCSVICALQGER